MSLNGMCVELASNVLLILTLCKTIAANVAKIVLFVRLRGSDICACYFIFFKPTLPIMNIPLAKVFIIVGKVLVSGQITKNLCVWWNSIPATISWNDLI